MRPISAIIFLLWFNPLFAQDREYVVYDWEEVRTADPDTVYGIDLSRNKLDSIPYELSRFYNLRYLNLKKNRLKNLPEHIVQLTLLEELDLGKNKFEIYPIQLCRISTLRSISIYDNDISTIPACIEYNSALESLILYDNPIHDLPESLVNIENLKYIDLAGIKFSPLFQDTWIGKLPDVKIDFDPPCDCMK